LQSEHYPLPRDLAVTAQTPKPKPKAKTKAKPNTKLRAKAKQAASLAVGGGLWLDRKGHSFLGGKRIALLESIETHGSITQAAKAINLSYKAAWDAVDTMNNLAEKPLVIRATGGAHGGGTQLTEHGRHVVKLYRQLENGHQKVLSRMESKLHDTHKLNDLLKALSMKTSARNQLRGVVKTVRKGAVNADVVLDLGDGLEIFANITHAAVLELGLKKGREAIALIKSSFVLLSADPKPLISARNRLTGTVASITAGAVNCEVKVQLAGGRTMVAIITADGLKELGLKVGSVCCAIIKASHVLIAIND
jgi:molybdate transport system regulatory protein